MRFLHKNGPNQSLSCYCVSQWCVVTHYPSGLNPPAFRLVFSSFVASFLPTFDFCYLYFQAILLSRTKRLSEAVNILRGLVRDDPQNLAHYKTLAGMYAQKGQVKDVRFLAF